MSDIDERDFARKDWDAAFDMLAQIRLGMLKACMKGAFLCIDNDIDALADKVGAEVLGEAIMAHKEDMDRLMDSVAEFYEFSGSDDACWDEWTSEISSDAMDIFKEIDKTALSMSKM